MGIMAYSVLGDRYIYIYISCITLRTLDHGNCGICSVLGNAGFISSTVYHAPVPDGGRSTARSSKKFLKTWSWPGLRCLGFTLRLLRGSWAFWGRVSALGARVWDLTTRVQEV